MRKFFSLAILMAWFSFTTNAQYNIFENTDAQHGDVALGDVDNDGDLDVFICGEQRHDPHDQQGGLYINDGQGNFTKRDCPVLPGWRSSIDFGDVDGDGDLDILFSGHKNRGIFEANARGLALNDGTGNFTLADPETYPGFLFLSSSLCFADFNNDGLLDYMLAAPDTQGHGDWETNQFIDYPGRWSLFFQQEDGSFSENNVFKNYFRDLVVSAADYDNDGDVDIFMQGYYPHNTGEDGFGLTAPQLITAIFVNDGAGQFSILENTYLPVVGGFGSHNWADLDGNGFLDLIICGHPVPTEAYHQIYTNANMEFTNVFTSPKAGQFSFQGANVLQDLDNDGDVDVLLGGYNNDTENRQKTFIYNNTYTTGDFTDTDLAENTMAGNQYLPGFSEHDFEVADLNGDYVVDYVYLGFWGASAGRNPPFETWGSVDRNLGGWTPGINSEEYVQPFVKLNAPLNLAATEEAVENDKVKVTFSWSEPNNIGTKKSVTYNLALRNRTTGRWLYYPNAIVGGEKDGWRQVNRMGNTWLNKSWTLTLPKADYEWTVQAIDAARFGGSFAPMQTLNLTETGIEEIALGGLKITGSNGQLIITDDSGALLHVTVYSVGGACLLDDTFADSFSAPLAKGVYLVKVSGAKGSRNEKVIIR
jgi:hypothetical protein